MSTASQTSLEKFKLWLASPERAIPATAALLIIVDTFLKPLSAVTLALAVLAVSPWLVRYIRAVELPGGTKVEFNEQMKAATKAAEAAGLYSESNVGTVDSKIVETLADEDDVFTLARLRIEIERRLYRLGEIAEVNVKRGGVRRATWSLVKAGVLTTEDGIAMNDITPVLNQAVHAEDLAPQAARWAIHVGPQILNKLDEKIAAAERQSRQKA